MTLKYKAAVLHRARAPLAIEQVEAEPLGPSDVLVRIGAAGLCHTDLEVIDGALRYPMPIILGHEAAGVIEDTGAGVATSRQGEHVILSWNPHCGHCFYCDRDLPILCEEYLAKGPQAVQFDGESKARLHDGALKHFRSSRRSNSPATRRRRQFRPERSRFFLPGEMCSARRRLVREDCGVRSPDAPAG